MPSQFSLQTYNSVSYADVVGLQLGLQRLPGETTDAFLDRLYQAANNVRDHSLQGTIDQIAFQLGLAVESGIEIASDDPTVIVKVSFGQIAITQGTTTTTFPLITIDSDNYWNWRKLSAVVADINAQTPFRATLTTNDGPAWQLPSQTSLNIAVAEPVAAQSVMLEHKGVVVGTERFNVTVPSYTLTQSGRLVFSAAPPANTQVTYVYNLSPFKLAVSQVGAFTLLDPSLATYAAGADGSLVHQLQEYTQDLMKQDPSYWGN